MKIVKARPPNFASIVKVFPMAAGYGVIFAYGDTIFAPYAEVSPEIYAHECAHGERQLKIGVEEWWRRYLDDLQFRYDEELIGHRAEFKALIEANPTRQFRRSQIKVVAKKLAAPLYGRMVSVARAEADILS